MVPAMDMTTSGGSHEKSAATASSWRHRLVWCQDHNATWMVGLQYASHQDALASHPDALAAHPVALTNTPVVADDRVRRRHDSDRRLLLLHHTNECCGAARIPVVRVWRTVDAVEWWPLRPGDVDTTRVDGDFVGRMVQHPNVSRTEQAYRNRILPYIGKLLQENANGEAAAAAAEGVLTAATTTSAPPSTLTPVPRHEADPSPPPPEASLPPPEASLPPPEASLTLPPKQPTNEAHSPPEASPILPSGTTESSSATPFPNSRSDESDCVAKNLTVDFDVEHEFSDGEHDESDETIALDIEPHDSWSTVWNKLLVAGWYTRVCHDKTYLVQPGRGVDRGQIGVDYFASVADVQDYVRQWHSHWQGNGDDDDAVQAPRRRVTLSHQKRTASNEARTASPIPTRRRHKVLHDAPPHRNEQVYKTPRPSSQRRPGDVHWWKRHAIPTFAQVWPSLVKLGFGTARDTVHRFVLPATTPGLERSRRTVSLGRTALRKFLCQFGIPNFDMTQSRLDPDEQTLLLRWIVFANVPVPNRRTVQALSHIASPKKLSNLLSLLYEHGFSTVDGKIFKPKYKQMDKETSRYEHGVHYFTENEVQTKLKEYVRGAWRLGPMEANDVWTVADLVAPPVRTAKQEQSYRSLRLWAAASSRPLPTFDGMPSKRVTDPLEAMVNDPIDDDPVHGATKAKMTPQARTKTSPALQKLIPRFDTVWPLLEQLGFEAITVDGFSLPNDSAGLGDRTIVLCQSALRKFLCQYGIPNLHTASFDQAQHDVLHRWIGFANVPTRAIRDVKRPSDIPLPKATSHLLSWLYMLGFTTVDGKIFKPHYKQMEEKFVSYKHGVHYFYASEINTLVRDYVRGAWRLGPMHISNDNSVDDLLHCPEPETVRLRDALDSLRLWAAASPEPIPTFQTVPDASLMLPFERMTDSEELDAHSVEGSTVEQTPGRSLPSTCPESSPDSSVASTDSLCANDPEWYKKCCVPVFAKEIWPSLQKLGFEFKSGRYCHRHVKDPIGNSADLQRFCAKNGVPNMKAADLSSMDQLNIFRWATFAHVNVMLSSSCQVLRRIRMPSDSQVMQWLVQLKFRVCDDKIYPPGADLFDGGRECEQHKVHFFCGLSEIRDYIRGAENLSLVEDVSSRRQRKSAISEDEMLALRLWAALSESPLPTFQIADQTSTSEDADATMCDEVKGDLQGTLMTVSSQLSESATVEPPPQPIHGTMGEKDVSSCSDETALEPTTTDVEHLDDVVECHSVERGLSIDELPSQSNTQPTNSPKSPVAAHMECDMVDSDVTLEKGVPESMIGSSSHGLFNMHAHTPESSPNKAKRETAILSMSKPTFVPLMPAQMPESPNGSVASVGSLKQELLDAVARDVDAPTSSLEEMASNGTPDETARPTKRASLLDSLAGPTDSLKRVASHDTPSETPRSTKRARLQHLLDTLATMSHVEDDDPTNDDANDGPPLSTQLDPDDGTCMEDDDASTTSYKEGLLTQYEDARESDDEN